MLAEGYAPGSSTLVAGPSGIGKTLMGLHFIFSGAANGEPGVIASLQENPIQLQRVARGFGWSLDNERVAVMYRSPNDVYIDEWVYELLELIEATGAKRVMIDSLSDLQYATPDPIRFREFIYSLTQRLSRAGVSPIMTSEIPDLFHAGRLAEYGSRTSPTTSSCCNTSAPPHASYAPSRSSNHAQASTTRRSASSR